MQADTSLEKKDLNLLVRGKNNKKKVKGNTIDKSKILQVRTV